MEIFLKKTENTQEEGFSPLLIHSSPSGLMEQSGLELSHMQESTKKDRYS